MSADWGDIRTSQEGLFPHGSLPAEIPANPWPAGRPIYPSRITYHGRPRDVLLYIAFVEALELLWEAAQDPRATRAPRILADAVDGLESFKMTTMRYLILRP